MRYTGWARVTFIGDVLAGQQLIPLARAVLGEVINRLDMQRESVRSVRRLAWEAIDQKPPAAFGRPAGSTRKTYSDGTLIEAGWDGTTAWMRITTGSVPASRQLEGYGFILSPFNGTLPTIGAPPIYQSTLLLINDGAYAHDYPDADHHWFTAAKNGNYTALGNEFIDNPLLQGNLHWRSTVDPAFHLSWLGNSSDPIPYFKYDFQNGYDSGNAPYGVRLSSSTGSPAQSGSIYNFDTTQVFSVWLADMFGGLVNLQNGSGVGQVICYAGHVVKSVYDLLKPGSPITSRNCIIGCGGSVDAKTKKRTAYFVVRVYQDVLPVPADVLTEVVYSLDIDTPDAVPVSIGTRTITMTGTFDAEVRVDPIPLHGYQWNETEQQFVCVAVQVNAEPRAETSFLPTLQPQSVYATTGKATWSIDGDGAAFAFDNGRSLASSLSGSIKYDNKLTVTQGSFESPEAGHVTYAIEEVFDNSFGYGIRDGLIGVTAAHEVTISTTQKGDHHTDIVNSDFIIDVLSGSVGIGHQDTTDTTTLSVTQTLTCGGHAWDVVSFNLVEETDTAADFPDGTARTLNSSSDTSQNFIYTGKSFLWFDDVNQIFAYLEFELAWTRHFVAASESPPPYTTTIPTENSETFSVGNYHGRYVVESLVGTQMTDWFDLTAGGKVGTVDIVSSESNLFAFMPHLPLHVNPGDPSAYDAALTSTPGDPTFVEFQKDFGDKLPLLELVNLVSFSMWNMPTWTTSGGLHTGVAGRRLNTSEPDGTYSFTAVHPGGWALNGKRLCFSQIGPRVVNTLGNTVSQTPFDFLSNGSLDTLAGATGDDRGYHPLCYIAPKEIKAQGQS